MPAAIHFVAFENGQAENAGRYHGHQAPCELLCGLASQSSAWASRYYSSSAADRTRSDNVSSKFSGIRTGFPSAIQSIRSNRGTPAPGQNVDERCAALPDAPGVNSA